MARAASIDLLAFTCAMDLTGEPYQALSLARDFLKKVAKSGLKSPFSDALLRRLALGEWARLDRPRPMRIESSDPKESAVLLFFIEFWGVTYEDFSVALQLPEERSRHLVHKARIELLTTRNRLPIPKAGCRRARSLLSEYQEKVLTAPLEAEVADHLQGCRECSLLLTQLVEMVEAPPRPLLSPPTGLKGGDVARPLTQNLGVSRTKRRAGVAFMVFGLAMGAVQLHPGLNSAASARLERVSATFTRWRGRAERLLEDLRVMKAMAIGTFEGRSEELGQTLDEYVNSGNPSETTPNQNKPASDAVLDARDPKNKPLNPTPQSTGSPSPVPGTPKPQNP